MVNPESIEYKSYHDEKTLVEPQPIRESREERRLRERNAKSLENQLHIYVNKYFKFISENRGDLEKQATELKRLNTSWRSWVNSKSKVHDVKAAAPMFIIEVDRLLNVFTTMDAADKQELQK